MLDILHTYQSSLPWAAGGFILVALIAVYTRKNSNRLPLPPMPKSTFLIGKTREALDPNKKIWTYLQEWKEETGAGQ